ncbi:RnfABCDGE type electron transport complex subunit D [Butyricicoccus faecihominis]|uniref:RnfABCDGE type electron transport complex subunit D n=1 Tax=Butyricicoccaceae TaxID=3085642 RepID=UPI002479C3A4|nr:MULTISPECIES: RnfABCDGE type electron transport complex subunit D [Butyricicoccaceae]MCQ5129756.1 RnfABCDGE type electron transport complex subunit D [Butyricicoccus faecihominis]WNX84284.1 RnfABCDGE type electron transport complex subunit D [Agathobaculum sp. NTUH-O15-33]
MYDLSKVVVTSSPHIKAEDDTRSLMLDVLIALIPALAVAVFTFGPRALVLTIISMVSCGVFEALYCKIVHQPVTVRDLSAMVTGVLIAFNIPVAAPWWMPVFGGLFGIIIVKMLFGGLGKNFMNPALGARAFMMASWPALMTAWVAPKAAVDWIKNVAVTDAISTATPLANMKAGLLPWVQNGANPAPVTGMMDLLLGQSGGVIGETSALALIAGGLYLLYRKVITINIPAAYILTVAVITFLFPMGGQPRLEWMLAQVLSGGLMLGAIFMATDYVTSPVTPKGQVIFGIGCGLLTVFIRYFGGLPEGVSYSILIMNTLVWAIDKATHPRKFGYALEKKKEAQ